MAANIITKYSKIQNTTNPFGQSFLLPLQIHSYCAINEVTPLSTHSQQDLKQMIFTD